MQEITNASPYTRNAELLARARDGDESAVDQLCRLNAGLVRSVVSRYGGRGVEPDDLYQLGCIGLLKAIRTFDSERGTVFSTYAVPLIIGEIRRFLRDDGLVKVSRVYKRDGAILARERERFRAERGCDPRIDELAERCGMSAADAAVALDAVTPAASLADTVGAGELTLEQTLADGADAISGTVERLALAQALRKLTEEQRRIVLLRFFRDYSQQRTADALGLTQVKISREERRIFELLRAELDV